MTEKSSPWTQEIQQHPKFHRFTMHRIAKAENGKPERYRIYGYTMFQGYELMVELATLYLRDEAVKAAAEAQAELQSLSLTCAQLERDVEFQKSLVLKQTLLGTEFFDSYARERTRAEHAEALLRESEQQLRGYRNAATVPDLTVYPRRLAQILEAAGWRHEGAFWQHAKLPGATFDDRAAIEAHISHQRRAIESAEAERNTLRTALEKLVGQWLGEADRSKLLQGVKCAHDLRALLSPLGDPR